MEKENNSAGNAISEAVSEIQFTTTRARSAEPTNDIFTAVRMKVS